MVFLGARIPGTSGCVVPGLESSERLARFKDFELDLRAGELRQKDGKIFRLPEQPFRILLTLLERPGRIVLREEIRKRLWPNDTIVEFEHSISAAMNRLRQALGDSGDNPQYIETLARRGYRWMVPVEWVERSPATRRAVTAMPTTQRTAEGLIGKKVSHYRVLEVLGGGGMGVVYKAEDLRLGRFVALKFLGEELTGQHWALERFEREARAISALEHPNICTIYEVEEHAGSPFIVMQLLQGQTLRQRIESAQMKPPFSRRELLQIAVQIADGLDAAHQSSIIHRDIKPANVFVTNRHEVKLLDFGLAKLVAAGSLPGESVARQQRETGQQDSASATDASKASLTLTGATMGTAAYMSPEQVRGEPVDARSDLFSFGAVLYEMATGRHPFRGDSVGTIHDAILHYTPPSPLVWNPDLPMELEAIISKALEKDRQQRYQSASAIAADLQRLAMPSSVSAEAVTLATRAWRKAARSAAYAAAGLLALAVLLVGLNVGGWRDLLLGRAASPRIESLAVLPLANLSADPGQEYFADGMTDALITDLGKVSALRVISRTSVMRYKGTKKPAQEIARELHVDAILEGTVIRAGDRVRVTANLIEASPERHLWSESYERDLHDVLALQDDIALSIAREIKVKLTPREKVQLASARAVNPEAYQLYLQGRYYWNRRSPEAIKKALEYMNQAIAKDPNYALAYAGLADCYLVLAESGQISGEEAYTKAKAAAQRALELDSTLAEAHAALATLREFHDYDWAGAEAEYKRAIDLNPNYATGHQWFGVHLTALGRLDEARQQYEIARGLDPLSLQIQVNLASLYSAARQFDRAIDEYRKIAEMDPNFSTAHFSLAVVYYLKRMYPEAAAEERKGLLLNNEPEAAALYENVTDEASYRRAVERGIARRKEESKTRYVSPFDLANLYLRLGDKEQALAWLEKAYQEHASGLEYLKVRPLYDPLRSDLRFQDLLRRLHFPPTGG